jgi:SSS family solute:Na+ symporter
VAAAVEPVKLTVLRTAAETPSLPWYAVFLGYPVIGLWYWCADQTIVQRVLGARSENHARVGPLFAGFIKILPVFIFVMPGTIGLALIHQNKLPALPVTAGQKDSGKVSRPLTAAEQKVYDRVKALSAAQEKAISKEDLAKATELSKAEVDGIVGELTKLELVRDKSEDIYAHMIQHLLPTGLKGVVAAALLAALMSTVSGALNSIATLFCYDIYKQWRPAVSDHRLVVLGRCVTFIAMALSFLWVLCLEGRSDNIYKAANSLICYLAPPITVVFVRGIFWRRASAAGAFATLVAGFCMGLVVFALDWTGRLPVTFMMAAFYLFVICSVILVIVSLIHPQPAGHPGNALVWKHPLEALQGEAWRGIGNYKLLSAVLFITMVALYIIFG